MTKTAHMSVRIRPDLSEKVEALASAIDRSKSWVVERALEEYLETQAWQISEIQKGVAEADAGKLVPHDEVETWVDSWGRSREKRRPHS